jgi:AcrR family transcriptional regulator
MATTPRPPVTPEPAHEPTTWRYGELSRQHIVDAAVGFCAREGLAALTMRKLAAELGLSSTSAYHYVASKQELSDLVADAVLGLIPEPPDPSAPWDEQVRFLFDRGRTVLLDHPGVADHLLLRGESQPNLMRLHRVMWRALDRAGFPRAAIVPTERVLTYLLLGAVTQEQATAGAAGRAGTTLFADDADVFRYGLDVMLDGLRAQLAPAPVEPLDAGRA